MIMMGRGRGGDCGVEIVCLMGCIGGVGSVVFIGFKIGDPSRTWM